MSDDWCPENDGAYRMELAARERDTITSLRARLEQAERIAVGVVSADVAYQEGFRAGIEAAAERMSDLGCSDTHIEDIRALSPTDNTTTVAQAAKVLVDARSPDGLTVLPNYVMILLRALASHTGEPQ